MDIRLSRVSVVRSAGQRVLNAIDLTIPSGQVCALLGPSGSGKTTLLRCINGLVPIDRGSIAIGGIALNAASLRSLRRSIASIYQDEALVEQSSVAANIAAGSVAHAPLWRVLAGFPAPDVRLRTVALADTLGLDRALLGRAVRTLSGGQKQRVGIARACIANPEILLADEPVANLDRKTAEIALALIERQARVRGATVMISLHQSDLAYRFADRIITLEGGRIVADIDAGSGNGFGDLAGASARRLRVA